MDDLKDHKKYLEKDPYPFKCQLGIYSEDNIYILKYFGYWLEALANEIITPVSPEQEEFIAVVKGKREASTDYEKAWMKLHNRNQFLKENHTPKDHKIYLDKHYYSINCYLEIFSEIEISILSKYGYWLEALADEIITPVTNAQKKFIKVIKKQSEVGTIYEKTWIKLQSRIQWEIDNPDYPKEKRSLVMDKSNDWLGLPYPPASMGESSEWYE